MGYEELIARAAEVAVLFRASEHCDAGLVGAAVLAESGAIYTAARWIWLRIGFRAEHRAVADCGSTRKRVDPNGRGTTMARVLPREKPAPHHLPDRPG